MLVSLVTVLVAAGVLLVTYLLVKCIQLGARYLRFRTVVNKLPGPPTVFLFGNVLENLKPRHLLFEFVDRRANKYRPIFRTWLGPFAEIHLTKPEHIEIILSNTKHITKSWVYKIMEPWLGTGLLTSNGSKWHSRRKILTPTFHFSILDTFHEVFVEKSDILAEKIDQQLTEHGNTEFDIYPFITRCALDIICQTAMGTDIQAQENPNSEYVDAVTRISTLIIQRMLRPWFMFDTIFYFSKMGREYKHCLSVLHGFTDKVIKERRTEHFKKSLDTKNECEDNVGLKKRLAFLDLLLQDTTGGSQLSDRDIREEVDTFMFEGHDTTTAGISWTLFLLGNHMDIQENVFEELEGIFQGSNRPITTRDLNDMKLLERVIKETLRLYPSVPFIGRDLNEDLQCGKYTLPKGVMLNVHIYHVHRDPEHFPNPEKFNPDNFLPERVQGRHPYAFIPFSAGPRNCIGQRFALMEEKVILATLLRKYKIRSLEEREDLVLISELILRPESGIKVVLERR